MLSVCRFYEIFDLAFRRRRAANSRHIQCSRGAGEIDSVTKQPVLEHSLRSIQATIAQEIRQECRMECVAGANRVHEMLNRIGALFNRPRFGMQQCPATPFGE